MALKKLIINGKKVWIDEKEIPEPIENKTIEQTFQVERIKFEDVFDENFQKKLEEKYEEIKTEADNIVLKSKKKKEK